MQNVFIDLIGAGGIGSPTGLTIAKMGFPRMRIWDDDRVEDRNLPSQMYRLADIGQYKADALKKLILEFVPMHVNTMISRVSDKSPALEGIVISAVDSMTSRRAIWDAAKDNPEVPFYIEARMGLEVLQIFSLKKPFTPEQISWYEKNLYSDKKAVDAPCTERAIIYTVMDAAGWIANQLKRYVRGEEVHSEITIDLHNQMVMLE
jgi:hypothetical protein